MIRARITEGLLCVLAVMVASWPLTTLLRGVWVGPVFGCVLVVCVAGVLLRIARLPGGVVIAGQVVALAVVVSFANLHAHLDATFGASAVDLLRQANDTIRDSPAPAPVTPGLLAAMELLLGLLAVATDYLFATSRQAGLAGVPLFAVFLLSTSNNGTALNPIYFCSLAAVWLAMIAQNGSTVLKRWSSTRATSTRPSLLDDQYGVAGFASVARTLGIATVLAAVIVPAFLPHTAPRFFAKGLAEGGSGGAGQVSLSSTLNVAADLSSRSQSVVLTFHTSDPDPPPLQVTAGGTYTNGEWTGFPTATDLTPGRNNTALPSPSGRNTTLPSSRYTMQITDNTVNAPQLAVPYPAVSADLNSTKWGFSLDTSQLYVDRAPASYSVTYSVLAASDRPMLGGADPNTFRSDLVVDPASAARVDSLDNQVAIGDTPFDKAVAIQDYLRSSLFTYSLTLAPTRSVNGKKLDPISNFLVTKKGYCVQFATAMVMMARAEGIPARLALGFLPGSVNASGNYTILESSAHAWPQLWLPGMGWTRFEPTPGYRSGDAPAYTQPTAPTTGRNREPTPTASSRPRPSVSTTPHHAVPAPTQQPAGPTKATSLAGLATSAWIAAVVLVALLGGLVLPTLARRRRVAIARATDHDGGPVEGEWRVMQARLTDLGIPAPGERSPRAAERYYRKKTVLDDDGRAALHRAVQVLEMTRYAATPDPAGSIRPDTDLVVAGVRHSQSRTARLTAALFPRSGREVIAQAWHTAVSWRPLPRRQRS
ncbi:transglutaminase-like domain-containing protein [Rudaeicoccus suwonensis]|uniref:Transglutaminase superfamily protein n=1 Tax=Rudaeicoccus suwonensis TaxID=657409 RepID=A0A561ECB8_9MICO|nr:transglutaminase-like domain-containing protein [Rudaeicoccus suwonensis]TWE13251.1 transglutaminase superfamily protein [Rudaeicoccus suwonensis]